MKLMKTTLIALTCFIAGIFGSLGFLDKGRAADLTCEYPLLDETTEANGEICAKVLQEPYQKTFIAYVCSKSCTLDKCLHDFATLKAEPAFAKAYEKVETTTEAYPKERRFQRCGNLDPEPPLSTDYDDLWVKFRNFAEARRNINNLLKARVKTDKNSCIRKDNTKGSFMRFKRATRLKELIQQCDALHGKNN